MFIKERLERRIAQLRGGIAILKVGSPTDYDREYLKLKAEDAIKAVKSALEEGVVEGGGMCLWRIAQEIKGKTIGELILKKALTAPLRKIIENAGEDYTDIVRNISDIFGYDAKNRGFCDLVKAGIIDPAKVERYALENSIYNAGQFITISASIYDYVEKKD
jgi:chaperonin GroEL